MSHIRILILTLCTTTIFAPPLDQLKTLLRRMRPFALPREQQQRGTPLTAHASAMVMTQTYTQTRTQEQIRLEEQQRHQAMLQQQMQAATKPQHFVVHIQPHHPNRMPNFEMVQVPYRAGMQLAGWEAVKDEKLDWSNTNKKTEKDDTKILQLPGPKTTTNTITLPAAEPNVEVEKRKDPSIEPLNQYPKTIIEDPPFDPYGPGIQILPAANTGNGQTLLFNAYNHPGGTLEPMQPNTGRIIVVPPQAAIIVIAIQFIQWLKGVLATVPAQQPGASPDALVEIRPDPNNPSHHTTLMQIYGFSAPSPMSDQQQKGCGDTTPKPVEQTPGFHALPQERPLTGHGNLPPQEEERQPGCGDTQPKVELTTTTCGDTKPAVQTIHTAEKMTDQQIKEACDKIKPPVGDGKITEEAIKTLQNVPGAKEKEGPITKVLEGKGDESIKGFVFELQRAYELVQQGIKVIGIGIKVKGEKIIREFDIITQNKLIECKNINWEKLTEDRIRDLKEQFAEQLKIAKDIGKEFEVHSKNLIPKMWKKWFEKKGIKFLEG